MDRYDHQIASDIAWLEALIQGMADRAAKQQQAERVRALLAVQEAILTQGIA